ncbi:taste receptor type 2 member 19-like [Rhynchocyon petersi]
MVAFVLGSFANSFIVLVNCVDWIKRQKISAADRILTALAVSRIVLLFMMLISSYRILFNPILSRVEVQSINMVWSITSHFSMWLATCLSIFYMLKIATFSNIIFLHLKRRVERVVLLILLGTLVILVLQCIVIMTDLGKWMNEHEGNTTWKNKLNEPLHLSLKIVFTLEAFTPFTMSLISFLLLLYSIWRHLRRMQLNCKGCQDPSTKAHIKAMQTMVSFLLLFATYSLSLVTSSWGTNHLQNNLIFSLCQISGIIFPSSHSFILILVNQKLRQTFLSVICQQRC